MSQSPSDLTKRSKCAAPLGSERILLARSDFENEISFANRRQRNRKRGPRSQMALLRRSMPRSRRTLPGAVAGESATVAPEIIKLHSPLLANEINHSHDVNESRQLHDELSTSDDTINACQSSVNEKQKVVILFFGVAFWG